MHTYITFHYITIQCITLHCITLHTYIHTLHTYIHRLHTLHTLQTDSQTARHTEIQTYKHTNIQAYRHTGIQYIHHVDLLYIYILYMYVCSYAICHNYLPFFTHLVYVWALLGKRPCCQHQMGDRTWMVAVIPCNSNKVTQRRRFMAAARDLSAAFQRSFRRTRTKTFLHGKRPFTRQPNGTTSHPELIDHPTLLDRPKTYPQAWDYGTAMPNTPKSPSSTPERMCPARQKSAF